MENFIIIMDLSFGMWKWLRDFFVNAVCWNFVVMNEAMMKIAVYFVHEFGHREYFFVH